jgi:ankyrin repeat protein
VEAGANIDQASTRDGTTPLCVSAQNGHIKVVRALLEAGADIDQAVLADRRTPLYVAAQTGNVEVVRALAEAGANIDLAQTNGFTPLYVSAMNGHAKVVRASVEAGANIDRAMTIGRRTPLYVAVQNGHVEVVRALAESGTNVDQAQSNGATPLHLSSQKGNAEVVRALVKVGAKIDRASTRDGTTPLCASAHNEHEAADVPGQHTAGQYGRTCCPYHYQTRPLRRQAGRWASSTTQVNGASARRKGWSGMTGVGGGGPLGCKGDTRRCDTPMLGTSSCWEPDSTCRTRN